ncbi:MAG: hypothetical protein D6B27_07430 [Gammaproteobacteria bacterium]|nr:MAG: hypothetical protein D6B27_07430 [Gammaproteobacteria bacterium]
MNKTILKSVRIFHGLLITSLFMFAPHASALDLIPLANINVNNAQQLSMEFGFSLFDNRETCFNCIYATVSPGVKSHKINMGINFIEDRWYSLRGSLVMIDMKDNFMSFKKGNKYHGIEFHSRLI